MTDPLKRGNAVMLTYGDKTVRAYVAFGSSNGRSLMLAFGGWIGGYLNFMPVFQEDDGSFTALFDQHPVKIERQQ